MFARLGYKIATSQRLAWHAANSATATIFAATDELSRQLTSQPQARSYLYACMCGGVAIGERAIDNSSRSAAALTFCCIVFLFFFLLF